MADLEGHVRFQPTATWVAVEVIDSGFVPRNSSSPIASDRPAKFEGNQPREGLPLRFESLRIRSR